VSGKEGRISAFNKEADFYPHIYKLKKGGVL